MTTGKTKGTTKPPRTLDHKPPSERMDLSPCLTSQRRERLAKARAAEGKQAQPPSKSKSPPPPIRKPENVSDLSLDDALAAEVPADLEASARYARAIHAVIVAVGKKSFMLARRIGEVVKAHREATPHANTKGVAQSWEDRCKVTFGFTARCGSKYMALLAIPENTDITLRDAYIMVGVKVGGTKKHAADTTPEGDETGGRAASESATKPTGAEPQDPAEQKARELQQMVENFYGRPKEIRKTFQEFLELILRDPNRNDPDGRDGIEIAHLADDFTRTMLATRDEIQPHTEEVWNQLAVHFPDARAALSGEQRAHENAVQPPEMKTTGGAK